MPGTAQPPACTHCGLPCPDLSQVSGERVFCCRGCRTVFELLEENGLQKFYELDTAPGVQPADIPADKFRFLDDPAIRTRLLDFTDGTISRITLRVPAIHCMACVWLLENLFRLNPGITRSQVNFPRREVSLTYNETRVSLAAAVTLLASLGYEPDLHLDRIDRRRSGREARGLYLRLGVAGFAFGNIMLLSLPSYFGLDSMHGPAFQTFFQYVSLLLALPVLFYSASDYLSAAVVYARKKILTVDFPIAVGLAALFLQSLYDILSGRGEGYLDSLAGLVFFLLCGRVFQQKTFEAMSFERDYRSYFPLTVSRLDADGHAKPTALSDLEPGDTICIRNGELVPADSRLIKGTASVDYSFVTGEAQPVERAEGDLLFAGGRQLGGILTLEIMKPVSQSYLTSLWNDPVFQKEDQASLHSMTNVFSRYFTIVVFFTAIAATAWWAAHEPGRAAEIFSAVLIVACPCALALSAPFALGTAIRVLGRRNIFVKNTLVIETLSRITGIVFDKTGTLSDTAASRIVFHGTPLDTGEARLVFSLARHSTHPFCERITRLLESPGQEALELRGIREHPGKGIEAEAPDGSLAIGSAAWLVERGIHLPEGAERDPEAATLLAIDGRYRGTFRLQSTYRNDLAGLLTALGKRYRLALVSGDRDRDRPYLAPLFGSRSDLRFEQSPFDKLEFIRAWQADGERVLMAGDGLNDAGALRQADAGVAVSDTAAAFSPASDVIMPAESIRDLPRLLRFSRAAVCVVWISFAVSCLYNAAGITLAASGLLSPLLCAILMPLSSVTVVALATLGVSLATRKSLAAIR